MRGKNYYTLLELALYTSDETSIKINYKAASRKYHPDRWVKKAHGISFANSDEAYKKEVLTKVMQACVDAHTVLTDNQDKRLYNQALRQHQRNDDSPFFDMAAASVLLMSLPNINPQKRSAMVQTLMRILAELDKQHKAKMQRIDQDFKRQKEEKNCKHQERMQHLKEKGHKQKQQVALGVGVTLASLAIMGGIWYSYKGYSSSPSSRPAEEEDI